MIKLVFLVCRKPDMSPEAFGEYWLNGHTKLIPKHSKQVDIRRYPQSHAVAQEAIKAFQPECSGKESWDGVAEVWLDKLDAGTECRASLEMHVLQAILAVDESNFVDLSNSQMMITEELELIA